MKGKFFAVGVGPGNPELMTYQAVRVIRESDVIAVPESGGQQNLALEIAKEHVREKEVRFFSMPMLKEKQALEQYHDVAAEQIAALLEEGKQVAFLTLGDPTIYSTVMYVHKRLTAKGYDTAVVNGIPSFCAAAASLNRCLCEREEMLHIIPATHREMGEVFPLKGTKVLMKSGREIMRIQETLKGASAMLVENATMENERVYHDLQEMQTAGYFSIVILPSEEPR